jgi:F-box and WD-40 domain protein CDC4
VDAMDQDLEVEPSEGSGSVEPEVRQEGSPESIQALGPELDDVPMDREEGVGASKWAPSSNSSGHQRSRVLLGEPSSRTISHPPDGIPTRLPPNNETPTRPRIRPAMKQRRQM